MAHKNGHIKQETLTIEEAQNFARFVAEQDKTDFKGGEGKLIVLNNAVILMELNPDGERVQVQFVKGSYDRFNITVNDNPSTDWSRFL